MKLEAQNVVKRYGGFKALDGASFRTGDDARVVALLGPSGGGKSTLLRVLGGLLLGMVETFAGGIPGLSNYRDGIAFAILILILLFKPAGILGKATVEKV